MPRMIIDVSDANYAKLRRLAAVWTEQDGERGSAWTIRDVASVELATALVETTSEDVLAELGDARLTRANVRAAVSRAADKVD